MLKHGVRHLGRPWDVDPAAAVTSSTTPQFYKSGGRRSFVRSSSHSFTHCSAKISTRRLYMLEMGRFLNVGSVNCESSGYDLDLFGSSLGVESKFQMEKGNCRSQSLFGGESELAQPFISNFTTFCFLEGVLRDPD